MILYFSGTGNSRYVAEALGHHLDDTVCSLAPYLREDAAPVFTSEQPFVIVAPIYAWRFPRKIEELLRAATFEGSDRIYFVGTMGANSGSCDSFCETIAAEKDMEFRGFQGVRMPNNYVPGGHIPDVTEASRIVQTAAPIIQDIAVTIRNDDMLHKDDFTLFSDLMSKVVNAGFTRFPAKLSATDACIACGVCADFCPLGNIKLDGDKPHFGKNCMQCFGCVHRCTTAAIYVGKHSALGNQYVCIEYSAER